MRRHGIFILRQFPKGEMGTWKCRPGSNFIIRSATDICIGSRHSYSNLFRGQEVKIYISHTLLQLGFQIYDLDCANQRQHITDLEDRSKQLWGRNYTSVLPTNKHNCGAFALFYNSCTRGPNGTAPMYIVSRNEVQTMVEVAWFWSWTGVTVASQEAGTCLVLQPPDPRRGSGFLVNPGLRCGFGSYSWRLNWDLVSSALQSICETLTIL